MECLSEYYMTKAMTVPNAALFEMWINRLKKIRIMAWKRSRAGDCRGMDVDILYRL
jgi:hypothetical protein